MQISYMPIIKIVKVKEQLSQLIQLVYFNNSPIKIVMLQQFKQVLSTPKKSASQFLIQIQDLILTAFEEILPSTFDIHEIHTIFATTKKSYNSSQQQQVINSFQSSSSLVHNIESQIEINLRLTQYFIRVVKDNFVNITIYQNLEDQTQKAEEAIRSHIKLEQQMQMCISDLENKIAEYKRIASNQIDGWRGHPEEVNMGAYHVKNSHQLGDVERLLAENKQLREDVENLGSQLRKMYVVSKSKNADMNRRLLNPNIRYNSQNKRRNHPKVRG